MVDLVDGNAAQVRAMAEQIADAAITRFVQQHPEARRMEIPAPLKWAGGILAAIGTIAATSGLIWLATTVSTTQITVARMDERLANLADNQQQDIDDLGRRVTDLEAYHREGRP